MYGRQQKFGIDQRPKLPNYSLAVLIFWPLFYDGWKIPEHKSKYPLHPDYQAQYALQTGPRGISVVLIMKQSLKSIWHHIWIQIQQTYQEGNISGHRWDACQFTWNESFHLENFLVKPVQGIVRCDLDFFHFVITLLGCFSVEAAKMKCEPAIHSGKFLPALLMRKRLQKV